MEPQFWHERWALNEIGFHQPQYHSLLISHWQSLAVTEGQVFVPLCGKSLDMVWLRQQGYSVLGIELSEVAVKDFFAEQALNFTRRPVDGFISYESAGIQILCGDFFDLKAGHLAQVKAVYDRAALIALPPEWQARYAAHFLAILPQRPPIFLITFEYDPAEMAGPPFSTSRQTVEDLFGQYYRIELVSEREILEENPGLQSRGLSRLAEKAYRLSALA